MRGRHTSTVIAAAIITGTAGTASAEKVFEKEDLTLSVGALLQPQALVAESSAPDGNAGTDFFLRRARLILAGDLTKRIAFFVDTEQANLGKDGERETSTFLLDAFASVMVVPDVYIDAGVMLVPFTRHALQSAVSLNGLDYHTGLVKYPTGSTRIWRDVGVEGRATIAKLVHLRGGIFNGVEGVAASAPDAPVMVMERNPRDLPRVAGIARVMILGEEKGFFFPGITFASEPVVSVGVGADWQNDAIGTMAGPHDHLALAADAYAEVPTLPDQEIIAQATFTRYDDGKGLASTGLGGFVEAGYRIGMFEPIAAGEIFRSDIDGGDLIGVHGGGNVFIEKHRANVKVDFARTKVGTASGIWSGTLQAQLSF